MQNTLGETEFEQYVVYASDLLDKVEGYQFELGRIAQGIIKRYTYKALGDFSKQILETCGVWRSPGSLRMYAYVYKRSMELELPRDILFTNSLKIVFSKDPERYARLAKGGLSGLEIRKLIQNEKNT